MQDLELVAYLKQEEEQLRHPIDDANLQVFDLNSKDSRSDQMIDQICKDSILDNVNQDLFSSTQSRSPRRKQVLSKGVSQLTLRQAGCEGVLGGNVVWRNPELLTALLKKQDIDNELAEFKVDCWKNFAAVDRANAVAWRNKHKDLLKRRRELFAKAMDEEMWDEEEEEHDVRPRRLSKGMDDMAMFADVTDDMNEQIGKPGSRESRRMSGSSAGSTSDPNNENHRASHRMSDFGEQIAVKHRGSASTTRDSVTTIHQVARSSLAVKQARTTVAGGLRKQSMGGGRRPSMGGEPSPLEQVPLRSTKKTRMEKLVAAQGQQRQQERMMQLMQARKAEFECLPVAERKALREAFTGCDADGSGTLNYKELRRSLGELGIVAQTSEEKMDITKICKEAVVMEGINFYDFCFDIVPRAREALQLLRRDQWTERFNAYDADGSGYLDMDECQEIVKELCAGSLDNEGLKQFKREFPALFEQCRSPGGDVDFQGFVMLIAMMEEKHARIRADREKRIAQYWCLPSAVLLKHRGELVPLYEAFEKADKDGSGYLEKPEVIQVLLERGLSPQHGEHRQRVEEVLSMADKGASVGFREFLSLVSGAREESATGGVPSDDIKNLFKKYDLDRDGQLTFAEAALMICESGVAPECPDDQHLLIQMMAEADEDGSGDLDEMEFTLLLRRMLEKIRAHTRKVELEVGLKLGYKEGHINELRDVFLTLDVDDKGNIYPDSLIKVMELTGHEGRTSDDIVGMLTAIDRSTPQSGACDFTRFLKFMTLLRDK